MASGSPPATGHDEEYFQARDARLGAARATDCAACQAPLPPDHRYLCEACVAASEGRAGSLLSTLQATGARSPEGQPSAALAVDGIEADDDAACPTCGAALDASGRCAMCVTTVRR